MVTLRLIEIVFSLINHDWGGDRLDGGFDGILHPLVPKCSEGLAKRLADHTEVFEGEFGFVELTIGAGFFDEVGDEEVKALFGGHDS
jgi:hypothetical protein